jgi:hypothetical protein
MAADTMAEHQTDLPFLLIYRRGGHADMPSAGPGRQHCTVATPELMALDTARDTTWALDQVARLEWAVKDEAHGLCTDSDC